MTYENNKDFLDWLYNRYVEAYKKNQLSRTTAFFDVLNRYMMTVLSQRKFSKEKRHAKELLQTIQKSLQQGRTHQLLFTGKEGREEFEKAIANYERSLRESDLTEEIIRELLIQKKMNNGNS